MFLERGYENTTVEQIAAAAGVSHMTFFRHFPTKEDVVMRDEYDPLLESLIASRPTGEPPVARVRAALRDAFAAIYPQARDAILVRTQLMLRTPALRARSWENQHATQTLLERALAPDGDRPALRARVVVAACLAAIVTAIEAWAENDGAEELPDLIDEALSALEGIQT
ncbi:MAG: TetR family transcriptional regulator [Micromonosporaceae bacterium]|nr:TetR family transcriptional regulator [Micromonosporaceae bacterium]